MASRRTRIKLVRWLITERYRADSELQIEGCNERCPPRRSIARVVPRGRRSDSRRQLTSASSLACKILRPAGIPSA